VSTVFAEAIKRIEAEAATVAERIRRNTVTLESVRNTLAIDQAKLDAFTTTIASLKACEPSIEEPKERASRLDIGAAILADLTESKKHRTVAELAGIIGRKPSQVKAAIERLLPDNSIRQGTEGRYYVSPPYPPTENAQ
jgi:hypothetical protein